MRITSSCDGDDSKEQGGEEARWICLYLQYFGRGVVVLLQYFDYLIRQGDFVLPGILFHDSE